MSRNPRLNHHQSDSLTSQPDSTAAASFIRRDVDKPAANGSKDANKMRQYNLNKVFRSIKLGDLPLPQIAGKRGVVEVCSEASLSACVNFLVKHDIFAMPVWDERPHIKGSAAASEDKHACVRQTAHHLTPDVTHSSASDVKSPARPSLRRASLIEPRPTVSRQTSRRASFVPPSHEAAGHAGHEQAIRMGRRSNSDWTHNYLGVISMLDIVAWELSCVQKTRTWGRGFEAVFEAVSSFASTTVRDALNVSQCTPFIPVSVNSTLLDVMLLLGKYKFTRAIVVDSEKMVNMITQSQIIKILKANLSNPDVAAVASQSISSLGLADPKEVVSVTLKAKAVDAFTLIHQKQISGVPVVDANGSIVGTITARDIRSMVGAPALFERMYDTVEEFLQAIQTESKPPAICVRPDDSLSAVLDLFVDFHVRRVFVVDEKKKPISVISLCDVISLFVSEPEMEELVSPSMSPK